MNACPTVDKLNCLLAESLDNAEGADVAAHVESCAHCQQALEQLVRRDAPKGLAAADTPRFDAELIQTKFLRRMKAAPRGVGALAESSSPDRSDSLHASFIERRPTVPGYEILEEIGRGGMGVVYRAMQLDLQRMVAVKLLQASHPAARQRFRAEAEAAARLHHPNIVEIYEIGDAAQGPFLALEFVSGPSLAAVLKGQPQPQRDAASLIVTLARTMHYSHQQGVVHRDLKPANVLLSANSLAPVINLDAGNTIPKISDFGLAKCLDQTSDLTRSGDVVGTPSYMAPEQVEGNGRPVGAAADIWGLGAILYELLTGRPPFHGETSLDTMLQVRHEEPIPPRRLSPSVPRDLEVICLKCLQKEPHRRYHSAAALADDLECHLDGRPILARPVGRAERSWRWMRRNPVVSLLGAALAAAIVIGFAGVTWGWQRALDREAQASHERAVADESVRQAIRAVNEFFVRVSEDKLLNRPGFASLRKELLASAQIYYRNLLTLRSQDPALKTELALSQYNLALVTEQIGSKEEAVEKYQAALAALRELMQSDPGNPALRRAFGSAYYSLGYVQYRLGRHEQAFDNLLMAREIISRLACESDLPEAWSNVARCWNGLGLVYQASGQHDLEAENAFGQARAIWEKLVKEHPKEYGYQRELARIYSNFSNFEQRLFRHAEALELCCKAVELEESLLQHDSENSDFQDALAKSYGLRGTIEQALGRPTEALSSNDRCIHIMQQLCHADPSVTDWQQTLAGAFINRASLHVEGQRGAEAAADLASARECLDLLLKTNPADIQFQDTQANYWHCLGYSQKVKGDFANARCSFQQACQTRENLLRQQAGTEAQVASTISFPHLIALAQGYNMLGIVERAVNDPASSIGRHQRGRELLEKVLAPQPRNSIARRDLGGQWHNEANSLKQLGRFNQAEAAYERAIVEQRRALKEIPENERSRQYLTNHLTILARLQRDLGRPAEAAANIREASRLWPNDPIRLYDCADELAQTAAIVGNASAERDRYLEQCLELLREAVAHGFRNARQIQENPFFSELRPRAEFQELLAALQSPSSKPMPDR